MSNSVPSLDRPLIDGATRQPNGGSARLSCPIDAEQEVMTSTTAIMEGQLARETPDVEIVGHVENVFIVIATQAKALVKIFAEGFFKELGRDAATRVPLILQQIHEKSVYLANVTQGWFS